MSKKYTIFLSLVEISGYYSLLEKGFNEKGYKADVGFIFSHRFRYQQKILKPQNIKYWLQLCTKKLLDSNNKFLKLISGLCLSVLLFCYFIICLFKYDVFIFGFGYSFFPKNLDLPILKLFRKKIIFVFHGSDARPAYFDGSVNYLDLDYVKKRTFKIYNRMKRIEKYASKIICQPAISTFNRKEFINWMCVGMPANTFELIESDDQNLKILHSPSNLQAKGTEIIREVISELHAEGFKFEYKELVDSPNSVVQSHLKNCSFVIDQLYSDIYMAGFATEAASYGKPSIIGSYEYKELESCMEAEYIPPTYRIHPNKKELKKAIIDLLTDIGLRNKIGRGAFTFVSEYYDYRKVTSNFLDILNDDYPETWNMKPTELNFINGCCISEVDKYNLLNKYREKFGVEAFLLNDKANLLSKILDDINR